MLRVKRDVSNNLHRESASVTVYFDGLYMTLTVSNNCACNATQHKGKR